MDKKTSKKIDKAVSSIKITMWEMAALSAKIYLEIETRLIQAIHDRLEYVDKQKEERK